MEELTVRSNLVGNAVAKKVVGLRGQSNLGTASKIVVLVHGYAVSEKAARQAYYRHERKLRLALGPLHSKQFGLLCAFHWPGDHPFWAANKPSFSARIGDAHKSGERLADFLASLNSDQKVVLIAHSLGNQVVLEALSHISTRRNDGKPSGPPVTQAFLMAAAVSVEACSPGGTWAERQCEEHVFYSKRDLVLRFAFGPGANVYQNMLFEAVGQNGNPSERWSARHRVQLGHGGYWESYEVAAEIAKAVQGTSPSAYLPERLLPAVRYDDVPPVPHLQSRALLERHLGSRDDKR